jgi:putative peptidoglycan lipid II flippase
LPLLSRQVRAGEAASAIGTLNRATEYGLFLTLPAALALIVCAEPIMLTLFGRGAFDLESVRLSSQSLAAYALGLPAFVLVKVLAPAFFARGDTSTPVKIGVGSVGLNLLLNLIFMVPLAHIGPALATSLAAICNVGGLAFVLLQRGHFLPDHQLQRRCRGMIGASIIMAAALWGLRVLMFESPPHGWLRMAFLGGLVGGGVLAYATAASLLGAYDRREIRRMMSRRRLRGDGGSAINSSPTTET